MNELNNDKYGYSNPKDLLYIHLFVFHKQKVCLWFIPVAAICFKKSRIARNS
jgi:hypothetical protein